MQTFGIDELRRAARYFSFMNETFNQQFTAEELLKIWRYNAAHPELESECADCWDEETLAKALA